VLVLLSGCLLGGSTGGTAATAAATVLLGDQAIESGHDSDAAGKAEAFLATATASGSLGTLRVYVDSPAPAKLVVGLYANGSGHPGSLLGQGTLTGPAGGAWNDVQLPSAAAVTSGQSYWIAILSPAGAGALAFRDRGGGGSSETSSSAALTALPGTWATGTSYTDAPVSAYGVAATVAPDTTPPSAPSGLSVSASASTLTLTWSASSDNVGVAGYSAYLDGAKAGTTTSTSYTVGSLACGTTHTLGVEAYDAAGNTSSRSSVSTATAACPSNAMKGVAVGPGFTDASAREVIRTRGDRVYLFLADDTAQRKGTGPGVIHAYKSNQAGIPTAFSEVDGAHRPSATGSTNVLGSPDVRLDNSGTVQLAYANQTNATVVYQTFSPATDTWGPAQVIGTGASPIVSDFKREGNVALLLDGNDVPHVVYMAGSSVMYTNRVGGSWSMPVALSTGGSPLHPQLAADASGAFYLSWLADGTSPAIDYKRRDPNGTWGATEVVASSDVLSNSNSDQGPSIVVTSAGVPYVLYVSAKRTWTNGADYGAIQVKYRTGSGWTFDPVPTDILTHTPQIYAQGNDIYAFLGHDTSIHFGYAYHLAGASWSPYTVLYSGNTVDGSASIRWDPQRETNANVIDAAFFDEDSLDDKSFYAQAYYMAVLPSGGSGGSGGTPPPAVLVGDQQVESGTDGASAGSAEAFLTTATGSGSVTALHVYVDSGSAASKLVVGLYASSGGHPGTLLTQGTLTAPVRGAWNAVTVPAAGVTSGTSYWLAVLAPAGSGSVAFRDRCCGAGGASEASAQTGLTALPGTWTSGAGYKDGPVSAYGSG
jgi:chitodextrinase